MADHFTQRAHEILKSIRYATIATSDAQGRPWNSPVYSARDEKANIYWVSDKSCQHSQNVRQNPSVFIVFYDSTAPSGEGEGVYVKAMAYELEDTDEIQRARQILGGVDAISSEKFWGDGIRRFYKAVPTDAWINAAEINYGVFIRDYRVEISLASLKTTEESAPGN